MEVISRDLSSRHCVRSLRNLVINVWVSSLLVYGSLEMMLVISADLDITTTLLIPNSRAFFNAMWVISMYPACFEVIVSVGRRVTKLSGCSILKPMAPVYMVPSLGNVLAAMATVISTEGLSLSSMMKFFGTGVIICDCANVEIFISVLYSANCGYSSSISWVYCRIFEANVCVSILCVT